MSAARKRLVDGRADRGQPRLAVAVGEWNAAAHLLDIREHHLKPDPSDAQDAFARYLRAIEAVIRYVDNL